MGDSVKIWCFILLLPFFAAIGHDFYINYLADDEKKARLEALEIDPQAYQVSDFGYLVTTYTPEIYTIGRDQLGEDNFKEYVDPLLRQFTFVIALIPAALFYAWLVIARLFGLPPYKGWRFGKQVSGNSNYEGVFKDHDRENRMKYKRR